MWEIRAIIKGYRLRARTIWDSTRLSTFLIMSSMADLSKAGIHRDTDLIKFPWDRENEEEKDTPSLQQVEELRELMRKENAALEKRRD